MHKNKKKTKIRSVFFPLLFLYILALPVLIKSTAVCASAKTRAPGTVKILSVKNKNTKVAVTWKKAAGAAGYEVYRRKEDGGYKKVKTTRAVSYTDTAVEAGSTYSYRVRAYRKAEEKKIYGRKSAARSCYVGKKANPVWDWLLEKYGDDAAVQNLIFVKHTSGSDAVVQVYSKRDSQWEKTLECAGWVGKNGIDKVRAGDKRTPTGTFSVTSAFGIKPKPKTSLPYVKVNKYMYWCGDRKYYNQLIDIRKRKHKCGGEHLIQYTVHYDYGLFMDFNPKNVYPKGSAIFFHCKKINNYTAGCIAVEKKNMLKILKEISLGTKICIYDEEYPFMPDRARNIYSHTKSYMSTAAGCS